MLASVFRYRLALARRKSTGECASKVCRPTRDLSKTKIVLTKKRKSPRSKLAFTLLEVLLAIAILAALSAIALPQIGNMLGDFRIDGAAKQLRADMTRLRVRAMREGRVMILEGMIGGNQLRIRPFFQIQDSVEALDQTGSQSAMLQGAEQAAPVTTVPADQASEEQSDPLELPEGVVVESVSVVSAARGMQIEQSSISLQGEGWSRPVLFYPDGVTSTGVVILKHETQGRVGIRIRGITGDVTIQKLELTE